VPEPEFAVVWPLAHSTYARVALNTRLPDPEGKRIGFIWDHVFRGDEIYELVEAELGARYPSMTFVPYPEFGNIHGEDEHEVFAALPDRIRAEELDAVIVGVGA
jgi:hypothetical protein